MTKRDFYAHDGSGGTWVNQMHKLERMKIRVFATEKKHFMRCSKAKMPTSASQMVPIHEAFQKHYDLLQ